jgi:hypothetical protein
LSSRCCRSQSADARTDGGVVTPDDDGPVIDPPPSEIVQSTAVPVVSLVIVSAATPPLRDAAVTFCAAPQSASPGSRLRAGAEP